jgi:hypothetical protein
MKRGTTPTLEIAVDGVKVTDLSSIYVTLKQDDLIITKSAEDIQVNEEDNSLGVSLSQKETLSFRPGFVYLQMRAVTSGGNAIATDVQKIDAVEILQEGVISL